MLFMYCVVNLYYVNYQGSLLARLAIKQCDAEQRLKYSSNLLVVIHIIIITTNLMPQLEGVSNTKNSEFYQ